MILIPAGVSHYPWWHNILKVSNPLPHLPLLGEYLFPQYLIGAHQKDMIVGSIRALNSLARCIDIMLHSAPVSSLNVTWVSLTSKSDWMFLLELPWIASMYNPSILMIYSLHLTPLPSDEFFFLRCWFFISGNNVRNDFAHDIWARVFIGRAVSSVVSPSTEFAFDYLPPIF